MAFSVERIDHVEVFVHDLEASARWYADVLGLEEVARWDPHPVMIGRGDTKLALFRSSAPSHLDREAPRDGWYLVAWRTDREGFCRAQEHLRSLGVSFRGPIDHGSAHSIYFHDLDGNPLEVTYYR